MCCRGQSESASTLPMVPPHGSHNLPRGLLWGVPNVQMLMCGARVHDRSGKLGLTLDPQLIRDLTVLIMSSTVRDMLPDCCACARPAHRCQHTSVISAHPSSWLICHPCS